jgi:hypothetical protein
MFMNEMIRPHSELNGPPGGGAGLFDDNGNLRLLVSVSSGPYLEQLPVRGMRVSEVRERFGDRLDIDPQAQAILDGQPVSDETVIQAGQVLMFARRAGEKG